MGWMQQHDWYTRSDGHGISCKDKLQFIYVTTRRSAKTMMLIGFSYDCFSLACGTWQYQLQRYIGLRKQGFHDAAMTIQWRSDNIYAYAVSTLYWSWLSRLVTWISDTTIALSGTICNLKQVSIYDDLTERWRAAMEQQTMINDLLSSFIVQIGQLQIWIQLMHTTLIHAKRLLHPSSPFLHLLMLLIWFQSLTFKLIPSWNGSSSLHPYNLGHWMISNEDYLSGLARFIFIESRISDGSSFVISIIGWFLMQQHTWMISLQEIIYAR